MQSVNATVNSIIEIVATYNLRQMQTLKGSFTLAANVIVFVSSTFGPFNILYEQHHRAALNPFLNGINNGDFGGRRKRALNICNACDILSLLLPNFTWYYRGFPLLTIIKSFTHFLFTGPIS